MPLRCSRPVLRGDDSSGVDQWCRRLTPPLPLAGEVAPKARVRALSSGGLSRLRKHPLPSPPPQAGEGAHLPCGLRATRQRARSRRPAPSIPSHPR
ncbi:hypothetical protein CWO91_34215 [Bradyrhizobium genosp. SA-3]|nr:hypothetical protein CWO91_34215 [Bradyrhizobium genosp. SA-3]